MCGRFTLTVPDLDLLARLLGVEFDPPLARDYRPRYNIAPSDAHLIVADQNRGRRLVAARWGLGEKPQINARAETAGELPTFRHALANGRCIVPADGFFEWTGVEGDRRPLWYRRKDGQLLLMAGLFEPAAGGARFAILTTPANRLIAEVHDRMPALLSPAEVDGWLRARNAAAARALLRPAADDLLYGTPVSRRVNQVGNDDPACLVEDTGPPPPRQLKLF